MSTPLIVRPIAEVEIQDAYRYLEAARPGLGELFSVQLHQVFERIEANPQSCGIVWEDVRAVRVKRFQYIVYFVPLADSIEVLAVLHGARDESVWKSRLS